MCKHVLVKHLKENEGKKTFRISQRQRWFEKLDAADNRFISCIEIGTVQPQRESRVGSSNVQSLQQNHTYKDHSHLQ